MTNTTQQPASLEPTLLDVCDTVWRARKFILTGVVAGIVLAAVLMLSLTPHYRAQIIISPANSMNGAEVASPMAEESLMAIRYLAQRVGGVNSSDFVRFENTYNGPSVAEALLKDERINEELGDKRALENLVQLANYIDQRVLLEPIGATPLRRLTYLHPSRDFSAYFLQRIHRVTDEIIRQKVWQEATQRVRYFQDAISKTGNPEHRRALTSLVMEQERLLMLVSIDTPYAASVVEPSVAGARAAWPDPVLMFPALMLAGAVLGFVVFGFADAVVPVAQAQGARKRAWFRTDSRNNNQKPEDEQRQNAA